MIIPNFLRNISFRVLIPGTGQMSTSIINSGTLGMEFILERTLPEFNQAGTRLFWSWSESFLEFENALGDRYCTTWLEVLSDLFPKLL